MSVYQNSSIGYICGVDEECIENRSNYIGLINDMKCPMCLNVVCSPLECKICQTLICENCYFVLQLGEQTCITQNCKGSYSKANKFVREILCALKIKCYACGKKGMNYTDYLKHIDSCQEYLSNPIMKMIREIKEKDEEIKKLEKEISSARTTSTSSLKPDELRKKLITSDLPVAAKMELYNACVNGKLNELKNLILNKKYPVLEEVSAKTYGWTPLHYSFHYGKWEIVNFILDYLRKKGILDMAMMLKSSDGRTPLLCLLRSNSLNLDQKKDIFTKVIKNYPIIITDELRNELKARNCLNILDSIR